MKSFEPSRTVLVNVSARIVGPTDFTTVQAEPFVLVSILYPVTARLFAPTVGATQVSAIAVLSLLIAVNEVGASGVVTGTALTAADATPQPLLLYAATVNE